MIPDNNASSRSDTITNGSTATAAATKTTPSPPTATTTTSTTMTSSSAVADCSTKESFSLGELPLPPGWTKGFSKSQNRTYYCHAASKHTQWHFPTATEAQDPRLAKKRILEAQEAAVSATSTGTGTVSTSITSTSTVSQDDDKSRIARHAGFKTSKDVRSSDSLLGDIVGVVPKVELNIQSQKKPRWSSHDCNANNARSATSNVVDSDATCVAIIVPYRDIHATQHRAKHLQQFIPYMHEFLQKQVKKGTLVDYHIYIVEQSNDNRKFNRGKLLNIGFDIARKNKCRNPSDPKHDVFIFHDVDLLPGDDLGPSYTKFPTVPLHIARVWDRYSNNPKYFGGIVSFSESDMKRINGYPNTFWGWGGEDDEMQKRCEKLGICWDSPRKGTIQDLEGMDLKEKLTFLKNNRNWKCMVKWEALKEHDATWRTNGLADLKYSILKVESLDDAAAANCKVNDGKDTRHETRFECQGKRGRATKITVDVKLNGNHWSNEKSGMDFVWEG